MPHFVTDIRLRDSARRATVTCVPTHANVSDPRAYRFRLAALRVRAPDTLRARVRRELRQALATLRTE